MSMRSGDMNETDTLRLDVIDLQWSQNSVHIRP